MIIGTTRELKNHEYRVGLTPDNVMAYVAAGHTVYVETMAGEGAGFPDEEYVAAGATILSTPDEVYAIADMIVKTRNLKNVNTINCVKVRSFTPISTWHPIPAWRKP